jgi:RNA-directed DNA polymerase
MAHIVDFRKPETFDEISLFLGLDVSALRDAISAGQSPDTPPHFYIRHRLPKKRGKPGSYRLVWEVANQHLRDAHRAFARRFADFARDVEPNFPHAAAFGYVRGLNIKDNASKHAGHRLLLRCDIRDFFPSITKGRLIARLMQMSISGGTADTLAAFSTIEERLALGLNASPTLGNLVCSSLDDKLSRIAEGVGCTYTRYADDIAFSGDAIPTFLDVRQTIEQEGFEVSPHKTRTTKNGQAHFVTGLSISDPSGPHVPRRFKQILRQELYYCIKHGIREHLARVDPGVTLQKGINRLDGSVRFVWGIEPRLGARLRQIWHNALDSEKLRVSYSPLDSRIGADAVLLIDETEFEINGQRHLALACVLTDQIDHVRLVTEALLREYIVDPFATGRKDKLEKHGLHFTDAPDSLRAEYVNMISFLPFRAYIAFAQLANTEDYGALYITLLGSILPRRLMALDRSKVTIQFEVNSRISAAALTKTVAATYRDLEERNERRPIIAPNAVTVSKTEEPALSLPDGLLWVFSRYFGTVEPSKNSYNLWFERIRDKYRHIVDVDSGRTYSRRHPIESKTYQAKRPEVK